MWQKFEDMIHEAVLDDLVTVIETRTNAIWTDHKSVLMLNARPKSIAITISTDEKFI